LAEVRLKATYRLSDGKTAANQVLSPLGLVMRGNVTYLVAVNHKRATPEPRVYPLHRMSSAKPTYEPIMVPEGFSLSRFVDSGGIDFGAGELVKLQAWVSPMLAKQLEDTKLSEDQVITYGTKRCKVGATVKDTWRLRWWLLSKAGDCVVVQPSHLRQHLYGALEQATAQYETEAKLPTFSYGD